jgi:hypothetical protein
MSLMQAKNLLEKIYDRDIQGQFWPFCFVLKQSCEEYIHRKKQKQTQKQAIKAQSKRIT